MGVDTEILINSKWGSDDICRFLNTHFEMEEEAKETPTHTPSYTAITFKRKGHNNRQMNYHREIPTPLGNAVLLTLRCNDEAQEIMKTIGDKLGGFYCETDTTSNYELLRGMLYTHDGIAFFLDNAVLENKMSNTHDMEGLSKYINEWNKKHKIR